MIVENQYLNGEYHKAQKTLKNFRKEDNFYYWYRVKKQAAIISKQKNKKEALNYIATEFNKISNPNEKFTFDIANFFRSLKEYEQAIEYYTNLLKIINPNSEIKSDILYRRGGSYERLGKYKKADEDLQNSLNINPDDAYVLNYLAIHGLKEIIKLMMLWRCLKPHMKRKYDPYIIDSIGWAYYLLKDYTKAESFMKRAVELMPDDPIVNDHYGDILWKLNRKIQARYFWTSVSNMKDIEKDLLDKVKTN